MGRRLTVLGIIPARGGSKALPGKHLMTLNRVSLIGRALDSASKSTLLTDVFVSTDNREIEDEAKRHGAVVLRRPDFLATDECGMAPVLQHATNEAWRITKRQPDLIVCLQPTSPFRTGARIDETIRKVIDTGADSAQTVRLVSYSPYFMSKLDGDRVIALNTVHVFVRRQDAPPVYMPTGSVYVTRYRTLMDGHRVLGNDNRAVVCGFEESVNIDTIWDYRLAELIARELG